MKKYIVTEKNGVLKNFFLLYINVSFGKKGYKYFIGYKDYDYKTKRLCIMLPKMSGSVKSLNETK